MREKFTPDEADRWKWLTRWNIRTVLDIGANAGQFASEIRRVLPEAMIYSFEPLSDCYERLLKTMKECSKFGAFQLALGDIDLQTDMHRSEFSQSSSLLPMSELHKQAFPFTRRHTTEGVTVRKLDEVVRDLEIAGNMLVKLDVQGYEDKVIAGGYQTINAASVLIVEASFEALYQGQPSFGAIFDTLRAMGFTYHGNLGQLQSPQDGSVLQADCIFLKGDKPIASKVDEIRDWERRGKPIPPPEALKRRTIREYAEKASIRSFIETSTFHGETVDAVQDAFDKLFSVELDQTLYLRAKERFSGFPQISIIHGDSGALGEILSGLREPCLFWLDGHSSSIHRGDSTAEGVRETPILRELDHILNHSIAGHVILIDDARLFVGGDHYPTIDELRQVLLTRRPEWIVEVKDDIIRIHSPHAMAGCCHLPFIKPVESVRYSRCVGESKGVEYWSRVYEGGNVIYKQGTLDLARYEAGLLSRIGGDGVPNALETIRENGYSVATLENVRGTSLIQARASLCATPEAFQTFVNGCLDLLRHLQLAGVVHRRIGVESILVREGRPVLIDFECARSRTKPDWEPLGPLDCDSAAEAADWDVHCLGRVLEDLSRGHYPIFDLAINMMTESEPSLRLSDLGTLKRWFAAATVCGKEASRQKFWWGKGFSNAPAADTEVQQWTAVVWELLGEIAKRSGTLKSGTQRTWRAAVHLSLQEITETIPQGGTFILADEDQWGTDEVIEGRRRIPFLEQGMQYWGPPADDHVAIHELQRLRRSGAGFIVFGWPAFWWLEHYTGFHRHLRSEYLCVRENDRLLIFDLQKSEPRA